MFPFLVPGRVGYDAGRAHHQHSKQDQINIAATIVLTGLVVCQCYRGSVYVQHSTQGYSDPKFLGYVDHMPKVLERKLKRKARKMKLGKKAPPKRGFCIYMKRSLRWFSNRSELVPDSVFD